jgi:hypothetical protein
LKIVTRGILVVPHIFSCDTWVTGESPLAPDLSDVSSADLSNRQLILQSSADFEITN